MTLILREPSLELADSFVRMRDAFLAVGEDEWTGRHALAHSDVPAWIAALRRRARGEEIPDEWIPWVPEADYWAVLDGEVVGDLGLRHPLNQWLEQLGGNIGYSTHPQHRGRGIATFLLREGLKILGRKGLTEAIVTCRDDNVASISAIEKCGGIRLTDTDRSIFPIPVGSRRRYAVPVPPTPESSIRRFEVDD
ncbi:MAG TPA: GNAT family N-acetyltransferase [Candidatus Baltobacteraceae bacterium]|jgi:predicted acetyltransferase